MKTTTLLIFITQLFLWQNAIAQTLQITNLDRKISIRGLSAVNDRIIWISGNNGTIGRSIDSGNTWKWYTVKGFEHTEFRDIEAFNESCAIIMGIGEPAYILKTLDGGNSWKIVYENKKKGMFLDAMEFWNEQSGIVIGDPIDNFFFVARTFDGGNTWKSLPQRYLPVADSGEACFAASGSNIKKINNKESVFVSGGKRTRLFMRNKKIDIPIIQGKETTGANSIAAKNANFFIVVGGDFDDKNAVEKNCTITPDGGKSWQMPVTPPHGYRSCIEYITRKKWICSGLNGVDFSDDDGKNWTSISDIGFHVCKKVKTGKTVFLAGENRVARLIF